MEPGQRLTSPPFIPYAYQRPELLDVILSVAALNNTIDSPNVKEFLRKTTNHTDPTL